MIFWTRKCNVQRYCGKKITPAVRGINDKNNLADPPVQVSGITVHQLIDFVKLYN
jgi:hypothetical protein